MSTHRSLRALPSILRTTTLLLLLGLPSLWAFTYHGATGEGCHQVRQLSSVTTYAGACAIGRSVPPVLLGILHAKKKKKKKIDEDETISHLANDANLSSLTQNNPTWDQNIAALLEYNKTHGNVNIPEISKEYPNLGKWIHNLRYYKGGLTKDQVQQLNDIGFSWTEARKDKQNKQWHKMFMKLQAFKEEYGHCKVPQQYESDPQLGVWVMTQRRVEKNGRMRVDRKDWLESLGFRWSSPIVVTRESPAWEKAWRDRYQELIEFKKEHNHTRVPKYYPTNKDLGLWVYHQRKFKNDKTLREDRRDLLEKLGFTWEFHQIWDESWRKHYEELKTYYQDLARFKEMEESDPEGSKDAKRPLLGLRLHVWARNQSLLRAKGKLDPQREDMLDALGYEWWCD